MVAALITGCALLGLAVGSFLTVLIDRLPKRQALLDPVARCPACERELPAADRIPLVSWMSRRGRCRFCSERISPRYPLVELATAGLFAAAAARFAADWALPGYLLFFAMLLAVSVIDLDHFIIPNRIVYPTLFASAPLLTFAALADGGNGGTDALARAVVGGALAWAGLLVVHLISPRGMGFGDVRLAAVIGVYTGWLSYSHVLLAIFLGFFCAAIIGVGLLATRRKGRKDPVPFGPFLAAGAVAAVLFGEPILEWWLDR